MEIEAICGGMTTLNLMGGGQSVCAKEVQRASEMRDVSKKLNELHEVERQCSKAVALCPFQYRHLGQGRKEEGSVFDQCRLGAEYVFG